MIEKTGLLNEETRSDFNFAKKAMFYDQDGYLLADEENKDKLRNPKRIPLTFKGSEAVAKAAQ